MVIRTLEWDDENVEHIARHIITPSEVEDSCFGIHIHFRGKMNRHVVYGKSDDGRHLMVVLEKLGEGRFRPITAREMTPSEKRSFRRRLSS